MGVSVIRPKCLENLESGLLPQKWMGKKIAPIYSDAGFDLDFDWQLPLLKFWIKKYARKNNIYKKFQSFDNFKNINNFNINNIEKNFSTYQKLKPKLSNCFDTKNLDLLEKIISDLKSSNKAKTDFL